MKADDVFCCMGTTIKKARSKERFKKVDYEYPLRVAEMALQQGAKQYLIVTAMGAAKKSPFFYNQVKGENAISQILVPHFCPTTRTTPHQRNS